MKSELSIDDLKKVLQSDSITSLSAAEIKELFLKEDGLAKFAPDGFCEVDPRDGAVVVFSSARAKRPHDNKDHHNPLPLQKKECPICEGKTTGVLDMTPISDGFTFINKNLFPCVYQTGDGKHHAAVTALTHGRELPADGMHFLQWTSSKHTDDWHNMPIADLAVVLERMGALERQLLGDEAGIQWEEEEHSDRSGYLSIIKNVGAPVGGSLVHGHQQIVYSNLLPKRQYEDWRFAEYKGMPFSKYMLDSTPRELVVKDFGAATLVVPYFMRRPYDMLLLVHDYKKKYINQLTLEEREAVAQAWQFCTQAFGGILPEIGREYAYNAVVHNGPGAGLYIEFLPFTQERGGLEQLGLMVCQNNPKSVAETIREFL